MPGDSGLDDHHSYSQNWNVVARPLGYEMGVHPSMSSSLMMDCHLHCHGILLLNHQGAPTADIRVA